MDSTLVCVCSLFHGVTWFFMGNLTSQKSHGRNARFWLVETKFAALWLVTDYRGHHDYWPLLVTSQASSSTATYKIHLILLRRSKAFHLRQNRFEILHVLMQRSHFYATYHILYRGVPSIPPPLYYGGGMNLRACPFVNKYRILTLWLMCLGYLNGDSIQK